LLPIGRGIQGLERAADTKTVAKRVLSRLRAEDGFGLIELSIAMVMLNIGILAIVAAFNSGAVSLARASRLANATVIADTYMERYRGYRNCQIYIDTTSGSGNSVYTGDQALQGSSVSAEMTASNPPSPTALASIAPIPAPCSGGTVLPAHNASYTGPDKRTYVVDLFVVPVSVTSGGWQKKVTVVVRDPAKPASWLVRQTSTFDPYDSP
jgi:type II secretory pathway pseudopilin PulG